MTNEPAPLSAPPTEPAPLPSDDQAPSTVSEGKHGSTARGCLFEIIQTLIATVVIFFGIQAFVAQPFQVQQHSMERTFLDGDYLIVDRLSHLWSPYTRGQVVVFQPPAQFDEGGKPFIKRIIGIGGDTVELKDGKVWVNGTALDEPYLYRDAAGNIEPTDPLGQSKWLVPDGQLLVLGDHREASSDSRVFGTIPVSSVIGRAFVRYWPLDRFGLIPAASYPELAAP